MVTGEITKIDNPKYGNLYLKDGDIEALLYGFFAGYGATGDDKLNFLINNDKGIKVGDTLTVITTKSSHNGKDQLKDGFYFSHESAE
ncbi:MAG: hypothetical protein GX792_02420 [Bacteroidales bacterium]|nr:hypothetical protein [Bacteroidales bacterium]